MKLSDQIRDELYDQAYRVSLNAYSPYSGCKVGAALLMEDGLIYSGCNVENSSYGATVCAERVALFSAISQGKTQVKAVLVFTHSDEPWPPCGLCRQVLSEFSNPDIPVFLSNSKKKTKMTSMGELCPQFFGPSHLKG